jgi:meso-butanediol dehydrogenase/(S,S)-butanediol dehydrogenase/diacetyl reductase
MTALVTGAAGGIGRGIALTLARAGADVAVSDVDGAGLAETREQIAALGRASVALEADVTNYSEVRDMVAAVVDRFGQLDIASNNAGIPGYARITNLDPEVWDRMMRINAGGMFHCCKAEIEMMLPRRFGRIVNTASIAGKIGSPGLTHYCASKFAVIGLTSALAREVAREGITVNALCPGMVGTAMWRGPSGAAEIYRKPEENEEESWARHQADLIPQGEAQTVEDMGDMVVFLAGAKHITGQALAVDGGMTL